MTTMTVTTERSSFTLQMIALLRGPVEDHTAVEWRNLSMAAHQAANRFNSYEVRRQAERELAFWSHLGQGVPEFCKWNRVKVATFAAEWEEALVEVVGEVFPEEGCLGPQPMTDLAIRLVVEALNVLLAEAVVEAEAAEED